jgi:Cell division protein CrgA
VPESKRRKTTKSAGTKGAAAPVARKKKGPSPRWYVALMLACFAVGVLWLVVYYSTGGTLPVQRSINGWNLAVGFAPILVGFGLATNWR